MNKRLIIITCILLIAACQKHRMPGKYEQLIGTWAINSKVWCDADSTESHYFELEFTKNANVIFRKDGEEKKFDIISRHYSTYEDYKIWYNFVLNNNEKLNVESPAVSIYEFDDIMITTLRDFFDCVHDSADYRFLRRVG